MPSLPTTPLAHLLDPPVLAALVLLLLAAIGMAFLFFRGRTQVSQLANQLRQSEESFDSRVKQQVEQRVRRERQKLKKDANRRRAEIKKTEEELRSKKKQSTEESRALEDRAAHLDERAEELTAKAEAMDAKLVELDTRAKELDETDRKARERLEEISQLTTDQARERLRSEVESELSGEVARMIQKVGRLARAEVEEESRQLAIRAMESLRGATAGEKTITVVTLPSDEMKGRVIGREGRNIRALELATGVDLLVDDTPQAILLSSWNPLRRAVAARALEVLIEDGRIHPARIEEAVEKTRGEMDEVARTLGEKHAFELGVTGLHEKLVLLLGRLSHYSDHGQSMLQRSIEVSLVAGALADELSLDGDALRRSGLLHEVARADAAPLLAPAPVASADLAKRFGEADEVTNPIRMLAQPPDAPRTPEGVVLVTAKRLVVSRPGARNDNLSRHMDRLSDVEAIATSKDGAERAIAVRAGRELRVHVCSDGLSDEQARLMARDLAKEIEKTIDYPGSIRVLVIRQTRAVSYAV